MANLPQEFITKITLNSDEAKRKLDELRKKTEELKAKRNEIARTKGDDPELSKLNNEIRKNERSLVRLEKQARSVIATLEDMDGASLQQLQHAERTLNAEMRKTPQNTEHFKELAGTLQQVKTRIAAIRSEVKSTYKEQEKLVHTIDLYDEEIKKVNKDISVTDRETRLINDTLKHLDKSSVRDIEYSIKILNENLKGTDKGTEKFNELTGKLKKLKSQLAEINEESKATKSIGSRVMDALNKNWGAITQSLYSLSATFDFMRNKIKDFAQMEEAMADTQKYTGLTDKSVRELNEDLKKMDTRTPREELNELAGAAGRLGISSKKDILDFVDAADTIKIALGDDLGEGAVDQIGKLAMAFGEDDRIGLRGAMLATGSAVNELAQNSSANAGYLVDFTARVAGFGKQLGLTQAQIMGFGAVMDENMLRDEMASTAFGNMLTKMQTDTAKFARIAGMDVKKFSDLLEKDANGAVLALADSLKHADPQTMMKMLDDMGLDGSRAVGVLATMADKIDDIRQRQQLATEAYEKGTSVIDEYTKMNNTVEAKLEKARNKFHEVSVELGEKLMPVMSHIITGTSFLTKVLNVLLGVMTEHSGTLIRLTILMTVLTAAWHAQAIAIKLHTAATTVATAVQKGWHAVALFSKNVMLALQLAWTLCTKGVKAYTAALNAAKAASLTNPWAALATVLLTVGLAVYELVTAFGKETDAAKKAKAATEEFNTMQKLLRSVNEEANNSVSEEIVKFKQLRKTLEDNKNSLNERKTALNEIKKICPGYHGQLTTENKLINNNTASLDGYIDNLIRAAKAQAAFNKMVKIQENTLNHEGLLEGRQKNQDWVKKRLAALGWEEGSKIQVDIVQGGVNRYVTTKNGNVPITKEQLDQINHLREIQKYNERRIKEERTILELNNKQSKVLQKIAGEGNTTVNKNKVITPPDTPNTNGGYKSETDENTGKERAKKEEEERKKRIKERADAARGAYQEELATEMLSYRQGIQSYTSYIENKHKLTQAYYDKLKEIYGEDSNEYKKALLQQENDEQEYTNWQMKQKDDDLLSDKLERDYNIRMMFAQKELQDESALNEALFQSNITYLKQKQNLYKEGSKEWGEIDLQILEENRNHQFELEKDWLQRLSQYRQEAGLIDYNKMLEAELRGVEMFYGALVRTGRMTQEEYDSIVAHIKMKYAESSAEQNANNDVRTRASSALDTAKKNAGVDNVVAGNDAATGVYAISQAITNQRAVNEELERLYGEDYRNNAEYQEAKRQLDAETMESIVAGAQAAYSSINSFMSAASSYAKACSDLEVAKITANYDRQIAAAGNNSKKKEKLEQKKEKEIAKAKSKANKKAMKIELAQAVASTALAAINAYASTVKIPVVGPTLAPIAAGIAMAAGLLQIATIKKQHAVESAGYYEGGFTPGRNYRKEAGVVHQGEFVVNHDGVNNQNLLPVLQLFDMAQRNNTIGSLTSADVSRQLGQGGTVVAPVVNVQNDNEELRQSLDGMNETIDRLNRNLEDPQPAVVSMEQLDREWNRWQRIKQNA